MKKSEAKEQMDILFAKGYQTNSILLELYNEDEDIPQEVFDTLLAYPRPEPQPIIFMMGSEMSAKMDEMFKNFLKESE